MSQHLESTGSSTQPQKPGTQVLTRQQLYERVWATPMRLLAKEFGLSDVGLAKVCRRYEIPRPPVGYWAKLEHGKEVERPTLTPNYELDKASITFEPPAIAKAPEVSNETPAPRDADVIAALEAVERVLPIQVAESLKNPHKFVATTERALLQGVRSKQRDRHGMVNPWWEYRGPTLGIAVSESSIPRALLIADAILKGAIACGFKLICVEERSHTFVRIEVLKEQLTLSIRERYRQAPHELTDKEKDELQKYGRTIFAPKIDYLPKGDFTLSVVHEDDTYGASKWDDGKRERLETQIGAILRELPRIVQRLRYEREGAARYEQERRSAELRRWEEEKRRREEQERIAKLLQEAQDWRTAADVRGYINAVEEIVRKASGDHDPEFHRWLTWANRVANDLDPVHELQERLRGNTPNQPR